VIGGDQVATRFARTPEELARAPGLPGAAAKEWQVQEDLLRRLMEIARRQKITHAEIAKRAGTSRTRVTATLNDDLPPAAAPVRGALTINQIPVSQIQYGGMARLWP
jgi:hypothetical protein